MIEKLIYLEDIEPIHLYGVNNSKFKLLQNTFPKIKMVARGHELKISGEKNELILFQEKLDLVIDYFIRFNSLTDRELEQLIAEEKTFLQDEKNLPDDVLVFGNNGVLIKAKTANQKHLVEAVAKTDLIFTIGPAGTGKTYMAIALAVRALKNKEVKKIILTRPAVEAGEQLGFLPGDLKEKLDPYMQPIYDALQDMIPSRKLMELIDEKVIQIAPLAFMRGRTLGNAFVICDEAQNATASQLKMFLTRMGQNAKFIITGDITQIDLPSKKVSGLVQALNLLSDIEGVSVIEFNTKDILRHSLVKKIVEAYANV